MNNHRAGDTVTVTVFRGKKQMDFKVVLGEPASRSDSWYVAIPYSPWVYAGVAGIFLAFHNLHAWMVYSRSVSPAAPD
jgi:hypothetical protein